MGFLKGRQARVERLVPVREIDISDKGPRLAQYSAEQHIYDMKQEHFLSRIIFALIFQNASQFLFSVFPTSGNDKGSI